MSGSESRQGVSVPTIELLTQELNKVPKWQTLGTNLGMAPCEITEIEQDHPGDTARRRTAMLDKWLKKQENSSWMSVIDALEKMSEVSLANHLKDVYVSRSMSRVRSDEAQLRDQTNSILLVRRSDPIVEEIENLRDMYYELVTKTESDLNKANIPSNVIERFSQFHVGDEVTCATIRELIDQLKPFFFLDYALLEKIIKVLLKKEQSVVSKLNDYIQQLEQFKSSTTVQQFIENIETAQNSSPQTCTVTLQLVGSWLPKTIKDLEKLLEELFYNKAAVLTRLKIVRKCVLVTYLVQRSEALSLIEAAQPKISFMMKVGVCVLQVGDTVVTSTQSETSDFSFESSLIRSVKDNDIDVLSFLLDINTSPDATDDKGRTGLLWASYLGRTKAADLLLKADANSNLCSIDSVPPLFMASENGHFDIVSFLIKANADPNFCSVDGVTPLFMASENGHFDIVSFLLKADADPNLCSDDGVTPLSMASQNGHSDVVSFLLKANANPNICRDNGVTPLFMASENGHSDIVSFLLKANANPNLCSDDGVTPLIIASKNGHSDVVSFLLKANANPNLCRDDGVTPLFMASQNGHSNLVSFLLDANANPNLHRYNGVTPLFMACKNGDIAVVSFLLNANADPNLCRDDDVTPLMMASRYGHLAVVILLLDANANPNHQTDEGMTALMVACLYSQPRIVKLLLKYGADPDLQDSNNSTALSFAYLGGCLESSKLLCTFGTDFFSLTPDLNMADKGTCT